VVYLADRPASPKTANGAAPLKIAMLAPPWLPVPAPGYGGIESVVDLLCRALVGRGHDVTLFATPGSDAGSRVVNVLDACEPDEMGKAMHEARHVAGALAAIEREAALGRPFDVLHDHNEAVTVAFADRTHVPVVHTVHGPFTEPARHLYKTHRQALIVGLSEAQLRDAPREASVYGPIANPIAVEDWPFGEEGSGYLAWMGRFSPQKGAHEAIRAARLAGRPLILAGPVQPGQHDYFEREIAPHLDDERVIYVGEVGPSGKRRLLEHAEALLMPISWPEPFGMVMVEAMACGTPVIAFRVGSAPEVVRHGVGGFLVGDAAEMAEAIDDLHAIDRASCRAWVADLCDAEGVAASYEDAYRSAIALRAAADAGSDAIAR